MSQIDFHDLAGRPIGPALAALLEPLVAGGERAVVLVGSTERLEALDTALWTYDPASFLPHGSAADGMPEAQPVWLTTREENPNGATVLVFLDETAPGDFQGYQRYLFVFDRNESDARVAARERWKRYRDDGHTLRYWESTSEGWRG